MLTTRNLIRYERPMVFDNILELQRQWTDRYVTVDAARPELKRFSGMTGIVKTVNFSGRALVEFDANNNIGWFDIDPHFLKMIDAPLPKPAAKEPKAEKKAAPVKIDKPAAAKPIGETPAKPAGSVADILAAARGGAKPATAAEANPVAKAAASTAAVVDPKKMSVADMLAAARGQKAAPAATPASKPAPETSKPAAAIAAPVAEAAPAKLDPKKMSVADMLAAARGQKSSPAAAPQATSTAAVVIEPEPTEVTSPATHVDVEPALTSAAASGPVDRTKMDVAAMLAYCRKVDGQK
jgi:hypothetical protein